MSAKLCRASIAAKVVVVVNVFNFCFNYKRLTVYMSCCELALLSWCVALRRFASVSLPALLCRRHEYLIARKLKCIQHTNTHAAINCVLRESCRCVGMKKKRKKLLALMFKQSVEPTKNCEN